MSRYQRFKYFKVALDSMSDKHVIGTCPHCFGKKRVNVSNYISPSGTPLQTRRIVFCERCRNVSFFSLAKVGGGQ